MKGFVVLALGIFFGALAGVLLAIGVGVVLDRAVRRVVLDEALEAIGEWSRRRAERREEERARRKIERAAAALESYMSARTMRCPLCGTGGHGRERHE